MTPSALKIFLAASMADMATPAVVTLPLRRAPALQADGASLGAVYIEAKVGTPAQSVRLMLDTSTGTVGVPLDPTSCGRSCRFRATQGYNPTRSSSGQKVGCHSDACTGPFSSSNAAGSAVPAICTLQNSQGGDLCPRRPRSGSGHGTCKSDSSIEVGQATLCVDHLNPPCPSVIHDYGYACSTDVGLFDSSLAGTILSELCPETCNICGSGPIRYCMDNSDWRDSNGHTCAQYASLSHLKSTCFSTVAYTACPVACEACGDCCDSTDGCYFFSAMKSGSTVTGAKYTDTVSFVLGTDSRGTSTNHMSARQQPQLSFTTTLGAFDFTDGLFSPSTHVDGVLGLAAYDQMCAPGCSDTFLTDLAQAAQSGRSGVPAGSNMPGFSVDNDVFALCLAGSVLAMDLGGVKQEHYIDANHDATVNDQDIRYMPMIEGTRPGSQHRHLQDGRPYLTTWTVGGASLIKVGAHALDIAATSLSTHNIQFDVGITKIQLPRDIFIAWRYTFLLNYNLMDRGTTIAKDGHEPQNAMPMMNTTHGCAGPIRDDYDPSADMPSFMFVLTDENGVQFPMVIDPEHWAIKTTQVEGLPTAPRGQTYVCMAVGVSVTDDIVMGAVAMKEYYTVFDRQQGRIGVAIAGDCSAGTGLTAADVETGVAASGADHTGSFCASRPCQNGATCNVVTGRMYYHGRYIQNSYTCDCAEGYSGDNCESESDECASRPCQHGGVCYDGPNSFTCQCQTGHGGADCSGPADSCSAMPCGTPPNKCNDWTRFAHMLGYTYSCTCGPGHEGTGGALLMMGYANGFRNCNIDTNECSSNPCQHGGVCLESNSRGSTVDGGIYECQCRWPYAGPECEIDVTRNTPSLRSRQTCEQWFTDKAFEDSLTETCCTADGGCQQGYPDNCNEACAALWMPFWKKCSNYMALNFPTRAATSVATSEYSDFAEQCAVTQYGDGQRCNQGFYTAAHSAMQRACRTFPSGQCSATCALTYEVFHQACRPVAAQRGLNGVQMDTFLASCQGFSAPSPPGPPPYTRPPPYTPPYSPPPYTRPPYTPPPPYYPPYTPPSPYTAPTIPFTYTPTPPAGGGGH